MKIFVSYTTRDNSISIKVLNKLNLLLSDYGQVYIDLIHNDSKDKQERVLMELDSCDLILLIETECTFKSDWVKLELKRAKELGKEVTKISFNILQKMILSQDIEEIINKSQLLTKN